MSLIRDLDAATLEAIEGHFYPAILVYIDWPDDPVRVHSGFGVLDWEDEDWQGAAGLGSLVVPSEALDMGSAPGALGMAGLDAWLDAIIDTDASGARLKIWFAPVTAPAGNVLAAPPFEIFSGTLDGARERRDFARGGSVARDLELPFSPGPSQRAVGSAFHTAEDQARHFPGDTAGRWAAGSEARAITEVQKW